MISKLFHGSSAPLLTIAVSIITSKAPTRALYDGYFRQLYRINTKSIPIVESFADNLHPVNIFYLFLKREVILQVHSSFLTEDMINTDHL